ncbi:MAG: DnaJ domain-containing protein [Clostridia bacterium]|nr:DnaJ domain-containing protein [Clostridia bacterium]
MNPYKVLGVSENATQEEIRAAYLALVKKYHPDKYKDNPLKELANERLKEVNQAYDMLQKRGRQSTSSQSGYSYGDAYGGGSAYTGEGAAQFAQARAFISQNDLMSARRVLDSMSLHNAEWHYLYGIIYLRQGWYDKAHEYLSYAYQQEPGNSEYRNAYTTIKNASARTDRASGNTVVGAPCSPCNACSTLLCADCCCECAGGDLIPCC